MKVLLQRVKHAQVDIDGECVGQIAKGLLLLIGIEKEDDESTLERMSKKVLNYRVFADEHGKMNLSVQDIAGGILAVSQFTLAAQTHKGLRPGFSAAAQPDIANTYYEKFVTLLKAELADVETGVFAADMQVSLVNDGPVTFMLEL